MRDDDEDDDDLISDDDDDEVAEEDTEAVITPPPESNLSKLEARRKLERLKERKLLQQQLGEDWSDDLLDDDL